MATDQDEVSQLRAEITKLQTELAATKAASKVTPEEVQMAFDNWYGSDGEGEPFVKMGKLFMGDGWEAGVDWLLSHINKRANNEQKTEQQK